MDVESWKSQLLKGAAELAVLSLLSRSEASGAGLLDALSARPDIGLADGAVYPLLNRLEREGRIAGRWEAPKSGGRSLKVYRVTAEGRTALRQMCAHWRGFRADIDSLIGDAR